MAVDKNVQHWKAKTKSTLLYGLISKNPYLLRRFFFFKAETDQFCDSKLVFLCI